MSHAASAFRRKDNKLGIDGAAMRPEGALLVACARVEADDRQRTRIRRCAEAGIDWPRLLELAERHGMRPLLYRHLDGVRPPAVPGEVLVALRAIVHGNTARNLALTRELLSLLSLFSSQGLAAVAYKGPVLAEAVYGNLGLREFADLDILVHREDAALAGRLMTSRMYQPQYRLADEHDEAFRRDFCEYTFRHPAHGTLVEIQWDIAPRFFSLDFDRAGADRRLGTTEILGSQISSLSAEDLLFILCVHGSKHAWARLEWICGVAELIRRNPGLDWDLVLRLATAASASRMLFVGLILARDLLDVPLPATIGDIVDADRAAARLAAEIARRLFDANRESGGALRRAVRQARMRERWSDRVRFCVRLATAPSARDLELLSASPASRYFAYPVRISRLVVNFASHTLSLKRGPHSK